MAGTSDERAPEISKPAPGRKSRLLLLAGSGIGLLSVAGLYLHLTYDRSVGSGPAGPKVAREEFSVPWVRRPVLFLGLGDSVTAGFGARKGYSYFDRLVLNPTDESEDLKGVCLGSVFPNLATTNLAVPGSTSSHLLQTQLALLPPAKPDTLGWVVITTGGNDLIHNYGRTPPREEAMYGATWQQAKPWIENFERRLDGIITVVSERFPGGCRIFLADIYDPSDGAGDLQKAGLPRWPDGLKILRAYNDVIRRCPERHRTVRLVSLHELFLGHGLHCRQFWAKHYHRQDPHYWYHTNLEDPNERGYDAIRRLFLLEMAKVAKELP